MTKFIPGWPYSFVAALETGRTSWCQLLDGLPLEVLWIMTHPQHLAAADAAELKEIRTACPHLNAAARHVHDFGEMLHSLQGDQLPDWMDRVLADDLPALHSLVSGLQRNFDAVTASLSTPWSSGQVEGHVTRPNSSSAWPIGEQISTSYANACFWAHAPATGTSPCVIA